MNYAFLLQTQHTPVTPSLIMEKCIFHRPHDLCVMTGSFASQAKSNEGEEEKMIYPGDVSAIP